ncbi:methylated-DNA--[protein]-cysteine S-methyltransferase [Streptomyces sp. CMB-StM0423]|uniref:methylated-DNA--[protein]-cysteine S-methyltransferase n=1 Tax=Streptomyces sp. CMB-StM0423 TaxID=2059884 RepID=UPI000C70C81E|nr:methylated-DNA--[protein]-cysteine S-methyltransferase [Streptomyces sp. CMB-StM0423]AUH39133.1 cysteine methyltransferase [Streptomyces sp. CMB-StM0423]
MGTRHVAIDTQLGPVTIVAKGEAIAGLYFRHHIRRPPQEAFGPEVGDVADPLLEEAVRQLGDYLAGRRRRFDLPLAAEGDAFQHAVWDIVKSIQCGDTTTYGRIAEQVGGRALAQRVGQAVGANPLCIFVPCHRVVAADGSLTGYAGGLKRKQALLEMEEPPADDAGRLF